MENHADGSTMFETPHEKSIAARSALEIGDSNLYARIMAQNVQYIDSNAPPEFEPVTIGPFDSRTVFNGMKLVAKDPSIHTYTQSRARGMLRQHEEKKHSRQ